ncbi:MAG: ATP-dependent helicase, partial [Deltaproteobacteria bacterium]|nr:ATP-dependent helicase [Deltaproteobacteria bacterium]
LIAHPMSMAHGVTLTSCSYMVYFSLSYSYEEHKQSQDRIYRMGQKNVCTYYYLMVPGSIDRIIYRTVIGKEKLETNIHQYIKSRNAWLNNN